MSLLKDIKTTFEKHQVNTDEVKLLLAVSGGKDSMVLMSLLSDLKIYFEVAHMNYQLRDSAADLDQEIVERVCGEKKITCHSKVVDTKTFCKENKLSTQEGARVLRYNWFQELIEQRGLTYITTAHHASDNHETFLQNVKRGSGLRGLKSMVFLQNNRCKPLLNATREMIDEYADKHNIAFRQDASNNQNHYLRNLIRNDVLPKVEESLPGFKKGLTTSISNLQVDYDYLLNSLEKDCNKVLIQEDGQFVIKNYKTIHPRLLWFILEKFGFNETQSKDLLAAKQAGSVIENENYCAVVNQNDVIIYLNTITEKVSITIDKLDKYDLGNMEFKLVLCDIPSRFSNDKNVAWIDADKIDFPLLVRSWEPGDRFSPLGMKGSKKVSDFLTDIKMPLHEKGSVKVLVSNEKIVWILNQAVSELFKINNSTKKTIKLETIFK
jgi:tRNA(Ile)-lysidine synthase